MTNPYKIEGPAQVSFSGGRSSGMMLCKIVEAHGGTLPGDVVVTFANTGKEHEATLVFVERVAVHLGVKVHWLEYRPVMDGPQIDRFAEVTFETASRNGEPFVDVINSNNMYLPRPSARACTFYLKHKPMQGFIRSIGFPAKENEYLNAAGIRADEPRRVAKMRANTRNDYALPLVEANVDRAQVVAFWKAMPFDLELSSVNGETIEGNCDLCYLKGTKKVLSIIRQDPWRADWWAEQERRTGHLFRHDRPNYAALKIIAMQPQLFDDIEDSDTMPCECTD